MQTESTPVSITLSIFCWFIPPIATIGLEEIIFASLRSWRLAGLVFVLVVVGKILPIAIYVDLFFAEISISSFSAFDVPINNWFSVIFSTSLGLMSFWPKWTPSAPETHAISTLSFIIETALYSIHSSEIFFAHSVDKFKILLLIFAGISENLSIWSLCTFSIGSYIS